MQLTIEAKRLKQAVSWLKGVGADYLQIANRAGSLKAMAAVFVHGEVTLAGVDPALEVSVFLDMTALQRFTGKLQGETVTLDIGEQVVMKDGKTKATFAQPAAARNCHDIKPQSVKRVPLAVDDAALLAKYTARDGKLSFAKLVDGRAFAHDRIAAVSVPVAGSGYLARRVLEWGGADNTQYYTSPSGSFVREPSTGSILFEAHAGDLTGWPDQIPPVFKKLENFPVVFSCDAAQLRRALQQYGKLDVDQAIRIQGVDQEATITIHGTKTVIEDELTTEADGCFSVVLATATLAPFLNALSGAQVLFRYDESSPYLIAVEGSEARLLTPRGA